MLVLGHRGASRAAVENTPEAFVTADQMGADGVELDVWLADDGRLLVFHDDLPAAGPRRDELPGLDAVLDACGDRMLVNVEIKAPRRGAASYAAAAASAVTGRLLDRGPAERARWLISSFSWDVIERCREAAPELATAYLVLTARASTLRTTVEAGHRAIHPGVRGLSAKTVERAHEAGLLVTAWTCNEPDTLRTLAEWGVDAVCTDVPDVALTALGRDRAAAPSWGTPA